MFFMNTLRKFIVFYSYFEIITKVPSVLLNVLLGLVFYYRESNRKFSKHFPKITLCSPFESAQNLWLQFAFVKFIKPVCHHKSHLSGLVICDRHYTPCFSQYFYTNTFNITNHPLYPLVHAMQAIFYPHAQYVRISSGHNSISFN